MQYHEFIGHVQDRAQLGSQGEAVRASRATLQTLADRLTGEQVEHLMAQLPDEIAHYLKDSDTTQRCTLQEFFEAVAKREEIDLPDATYHARVVMSVVKDALAAGEWQHLQDQLPEDYQALLEAGYEGSME